jgi:hypothetical protein
VEPALGKDLLRHIEQLAPAPGGREAGGGSHNPTLTRNSAGTQESDGERRGVRHPKSSPPADARRPPEPLRPEPAKRAGFTILMARARRMRYRRRTR